MTRTGVVVVTHGEAAVDMVAAIEAMAGPLADVRSVSVHAGEERAETERRLALAVDELHVDDVLFLVDLEGSTPFNLCCRRCTGHSVVLSGMNMPMLLKLSTTARDVGAEALAEELLATGKKSIHIRTRG